ncbi:BTAD domain-containing putative transcriptional regulator [Streptomyces niveus]|uniref:AfsR/SARP family transcriptional regulator n=1 Tax=Streptomyces niveus TaxID=193462 RepID=UPI0036442F55
MRSVLATLLVHGDQVVPVSSLIRELWDEDPPVSCLTTLQTYILNLRKLLASATGLDTRQVAAEMLVTRSGGYLFRMNRGDLDVHRFHQLVADGRKALSSGDDVTALSTLSSALQLWRGPALVDVVVGSILEGRRQQFEEARLVVLEYLVDTQLRLGMYREVLSELAALTADNPYHEGLHTQYMRALYLNGRRAQALEIFQRLRDNLVTNLGLDPGPAAQQLHRSILNAEPIDAQGGLRRPTGDIVRMSSSGAARVY